MDWIIAFKDYVPFFEALVWATLIAFVLRAVSRSGQASKLLAVIEERIKRGSGFGIGKGWFTLDPDSDLREMREVKPSPASEPARLAVEPSADDPAANIRDRLIKLRMETKNVSRDIFLAHVLEPSRVPGQRFDIFVYLKHQGSDGHAGLDEVRKADFYFGRYWGNQVFSVENNGGPIGVRTSAYGSFLCVCCITFVDNQQAFQYRFLDFEMGEQTSVLAGGKQ